MIRGLYEGDISGKLLLANFLRVNISKTLLKVSNIVFLKLRRKHLKVYKPVSTILNKVIKVVDRKGNNKVNKDGDEGKHLKINEEA